MINEKEPPALLQVGADVIASEPEMLPTIGEHAERLRLKPWEVGAIVARLHGKYPDGASRNTRMSANDFDKAADVALRGRV